MTSIREVFTIVLLGYTGGGKSSLINAFANLFKFKKFDDVMKGETAIFIPGEMSAYDENFQEVSIKYEANIEPGRALKVIHEDIDSNVTQFPQSYLIEMPTYSVRLIDTPGIMDIRGVEMDDKNHRAIMDHLSSFKQINAIAIVNGNDDSRLTASFRYAINGLLMNLHKSATNNIIFIFTHTGHSNTPGNTLTTLNSQLDIINKKHNTAIKTKGDNVFCFENQWIRELVKYSKTNELTIPEKDLAKYFDLGKQQVERLINTMRNMGAHDSMESVCLFRVRTFISFLYQPVASAIKTLEKNRTTNSTSATTDPATGEIIVTRKENKLKELARPRTVCTSDSCSKIKKVDGKKVVDYKVCHDDCYLPGITHTMKPNELLKYCCAFEHSGDFLCHRCECSYATHVHIQYEIYEETKTTRLPASNGQNMATALDNIKNQDANEKKLLQNACAEIVAFLRANSIMVDNDAFAEHMDLLIEEEKKSNPNSDVVRNLEQLKVDHKNKVDAIQIQISQNKRNAKSVSEMNKLLDDLYKLEISGPLLKQIKDKEMQHLQDDDNSVNQDIVLSLM